MENMACNASAGVQIWICRGGGHAGVSPLHPTRNFFEKSFWTSKNLKKIYFAICFGNIVFKVLEGVWGNFFQEVPPRVPHKYQFARQAPLAVFFCIPLAFFGKIWYSNREIRKRKDGLPI